MKKRILYFFVALVLASPCLAGTQTTSGITAQTLIDRLRQDVNDSTTTLFTDAEAARWCDESVKIIASQARCMEGYSACTLTANTMTYSMSVSHYDIESAWYDSQSTSAPQRYFFLQKVDPAAIFNLPREGGRPAFWFEWAGYIGFWPVPGTAESGKDVTVYYVKKPTGVSGVSSAIETPFYFDPVILLYLKAKYAEKDQDEGRAAYYKGLFYQAIEKYKTDVRLPRQTIPPAVK